MDKAGVKADKAVVALGTNPAAFVETIKQGKFFAREPKVRKVF